MPKASTVQTNIVSSSLIPFILHKISSLNLHRFRIRDDGLGGEEFARRFAPPSG